MSRATHYLLVPPTPNLWISGAFLPLVAGVHAHDWDIVEEELDSEWVAATRALASAALPAGEVGDDTPMGLDAEKLPRGARISAKGDTPMALPTIDQVVSKYVETRDELKRMQAELDEKTKPLKEFQKNREQWLMSELNKQDATSVKTPHGTVYKTTTESVTVADWTQVFKYIVETKQYNLLTQAVNKTAVLEIMGEERNNPLPPGVNYTAIRTVNVRKS